MASTGNQFVGTGENNAGIGATAWTSPGNVVSDNTTDATCNAAASSQYLVGRNAPLTSVPTNATIVGVTVRVEASEHSGGTEDLNVQLQNASGTLFGSSKLLNISGTAKAVYTYGGAADLWGAAITPAIVHDADFGVRCWFTTAHDVRVDFITIAVEYTVPAPGVSTETDTALALAITKIVAVGVCTETDTALALTRTKLVYPHTRSSLLTGLIAYWNLSEASGVRADSHVNALNLEDVNTVGQAAAGGPDGGDCAAFVRASAEYLKRNSEPLLQTGDIDFTFSAWARKNAGSSAEYAIVGKDALGQREFILELISGALISHGTAVEVLNAGAFADTTWVHVILEYEASGNEFRVYRDNGSPVSHSDSGPVVAGTASFQIGAREYVGAEDRWDGRIAYVGYWKKLLSSGEKTKVNAGGLGLPYAGILADFTPATETDTAVAPTVAKVTSYRANETDSAFALGVVKSRATGLSSETDAALAVTRTKAYAVARANETDAALALAATKVRATGVAAETDSALALTRVKVRAVGMASDTETGAALTVVKVRATGRSDETDTALAPDVALDVGYTYGRADETDTAFGLARTKVYTTARSDETDAALAVTRTKVVPVGRANDTETALALTASKAIATGRANETDAAVTLTAVKIRSVGFGLETDSAAAVTITKRKAVGRADETDSAQAPTVGFGGIIGPPIPLGLVYTGAVRPVYLAADPLGLTITRKPVYTRA